MAPRTLEQRRRTEAARRAAIADAARRGGLVAELAARFGISEGRVRLVCRREGLTFSGAGGVGNRAAHRRLRRSIADAAAKGATAPDLAARFGVSPRMVRSACREFGATLQRPPSPQAVRLLAERLAVAKRLGGEGVNSTAAIAARFDSPRARKIARLLLSSGLSASMIAPRCGVSRQRVLQVWATLKESAGKPRPRRGRPPRASRPPTPALRPT